MIISCPACGTRYDIPDDAIGTAGRRLKCAACGHGWHATAADAVAAEPEPAGGDADGAVSAPAPVSAAMVDPIAPLPVAPDVPPLAAAAEEARALDEADGASPYDYAPPFEQRRGGTRWLLWLLVVLALLGIAAVAVVKLDPGGMAGRIGLVRAGGPSPMVISFTSRPARRPMDSGNELLAVAGRITNPTATPQRVPDIHAELHDAQGRTVYGWTIGAPATRLAPGQSADFNAAEVDVPQAARTIHLRPSTTPQV